MPKINSVTPIRFIKGSAAIRFEFVADNPENPIKMRLSAMPTIEGMKGVAPAKGTAKFDYDKKINVDLTAQELSMIAQMCDLFSDGRLTKFTGFAKANRIPTSIIHDSSKNVNMPDATTNKIVEFEAKSDSQVFFRVKLMEGSKVLNRVIVILDYWEIIHMRDMLRWSAASMQGLNQIDVHMQYKGSVARQNNNQQVPRAA